MLIAFHIMTFIETSSAIPWQLWKTYYGTSKLVLKMVQRTTSWQFFEELPENYYINCLNSKNSVILIMLNLMSIKGIRAQECCVLCS